MTTAATKAGDQATVTVSVAVDRRAAFDVFTRETDLWWRRGFAYRVGGRNPGTLMFEPREGRPVIRNLQQRRRPTDF